MSIKSLACLTYSIEQINRPKFCFEAHEDEFHSFWAKVPIFFNDRCLSLESLNLDVLFFVFIHFGQFLYKLKPTARRNWNVCQTCQINDSVYFILSSSWVQGEFLHHPKIQYRHPCMNVCIFYMWMYLIKSWIALSSFSVSFFALQ